MDAVSDTQTRRYSYETMELLRTSFERWKAERVSSADGTSREVSFHMIHVAFEALRDRGEREYLSALTSTLNLSDDAVARLRRDAAVILNESAEFRDLLEEIANDSTPVDPTFEMISEP